MTITDLAVLAGTEPRGGLIEITEADALDIVGAYRDACEQCHTVAEANAGLQAQLVASDTALAAARAQIAELRRGLRAES